MTPDSQMDVAFLPVVTVTTPSTSSSVSCIPGITSRVGAKSRTAPVNPEAESSRPSPPASKQFAKCFFAGGTGSRYFNSSSLRSLSFFPARHFHSCNGVSSFSVLSALPAPLQQIVESFQAVPDARMRYRQLLFYASELKGLPAEEHTPENKVQGCVSQVWVVGRLEGDRVYFLGDSDSELTKGLAALLVKGLTGSTVEEILSVPPTFIQDLGLNQSLTPSRNNGFLNMLKRMQRIASELRDSSGNESNGAVSRSSDNGQSSNGTVYEAIQQKLTAGLSPEHLRIIDESSAHAGHAGAAGYSGESHFRVEIVSAAFDGKNVVSRHRMVYALLADEMKHRIHALALSTKTPKEALLVPQ